MKQLNQTNNVITYNVQCFFIFYLTLAGETGSKICGPASLKCYRKAENRLYGEDIIAGLKYSDARAFRSECNCLPACLTITYDVDIDRSKFNFLETLNSYKTPLDKYTG